MLWNLAYLSGAYLVIPRVCAMFFPQKWFTLCAVLFLIPLSLICFFVDKLRFFGVPELKTQGMCATIAGYFFWLWLKLNPQIRIQELGSSVKMENIPKGAFILTNHTSFFDSMVVTASFPRNIIANVKIPVKASLAKIPVFGPMFKYCGHFPVFFKADASGWKAESGDNFAVDKEKQEKIVARMEQFIANKSGMLAICPEGVMNPDPFKLLPFRHGSFTLAIKYKSPLYAYLHFGCHISWPLRQTLGGVPAHIKYRVVKLNVDYAPVDGVEVTAGQVADQCRLQMQKELDSLLRAS